MHFRGLLSTLSLTAVMCMAYEPALAADPGNDPAVSAAQNWLAKIDDGAYGQAWQEASSYFKGNVRREDFVHKMDGARKPLGKVLIRTFSDKHSLTSVPGGPDGTYVVIQFDTSFAEKKAAVETVTPMLDKDGKWRVSGYFIR